ncbi:MAG: hypothetical protein LBC20_16775 [Planctomycetaceae bacterium]|jgi:hypothetical protein|nr:hypothetical protein [Planctomycetaceae bacterium]
MQHLNNILILIFFSLFSYGCNFDSPTPAGFPQKFVSCELVILQESHPLEQAFVKLIPVNETEKDWSIGGYTDDKGAVIPYTYGKWKGVPPGNYKITINKINENNKGVAFSFVELQYTQPKTTPLNLEVTKGKINQTLEVGHAVNIKMP